LKKEPIRSKWIISKWILGGYLFKFVLSYSYHGAPAALREVLPVVKGYSPHTRYTLPKESFPKLPECFKKTLRGVVVIEARQYRGTWGAHLYEHEDRWVLHRDIADAEKDPVGHLVNDAPEYIISTLLMAGVGIITGRRTKGSARGTALLAASLAGTFVLVSGKLIKTLKGDSAEGEGPAPRIG
jgi:hypothetical protein